MNKTTGNEVLLTSDDVRRWQEELQQAEARIEDLKKKLAAAALLSGVLAPVDADEESMGEAVKRILAKLHRSAFHHEIQVELRKTPKFREILERNAGAYYYTVIARLKKREEIKKAGKKRIRLAPKNEAPAEGNPESAS